LNSRDDGRDFHDCPGFSLRYGSWQHRNRQSQVESPYECRDNHGTGSLGIDYAKFHTRSHDAVIRVYDSAGNMIETHEHKGDFKELIQSETARHGPMIRCIRSGDGGLQSRYALGKYRARAHTRARV
jgi:hypothetical protein